MAKFRKKGEVGSKRNYISRDKAIKKLQLNIKDFRRLCIIKGIYPIEVKASKITKSSKKKTYYHANDIKYLSNEPLIWKFWAFKTYIKRITKCKGRGDYDLLNSVSKTKPSLKFDHVLKERYPKFSDALRDIDDALCLCFLYANLVKSESLPGQIIDYCKRLTSEFMHYVIETKSLKKVFISIKGYYFQVQIMGQIINFIIPHKFSIAPQTDIDYSVMRTFTEFYITLLGFVNYKLLTSINFHYPLKADLPIIQKEKLNYTIGSGKVDKKLENIFCLNKPLIKIKCLDLIKENDNLEYFEDENEYHKHVKFQNLFENLKFYLNSEVPKDILVFIIRSFGGKVSWNKYLGIGCTFNEDDETITHQIVDRDTFKKKYLNRHYVQPQWIFDSINAKKLLPVDDYFIGVTLPPHLSPFVEEKEGDYVPLEKQALEKYGRLRVEDNEEVDEENKVNVEDKNDNVENESDNVENESDNENNSIDLNDKNLNKLDKKIINRNINKSSIKNTKTLNKSEKNRLTKLAKLKMKVESGKVEKIDLKQKKNQEQFEEKKLKEMMIPKKKKRLYHKIVKSQRYKQEEIKKLKAKRDLITKKKKQLNNKKLLAN